MNLTLQGPDWKYGDVLRLPYRDGHDYLYMFLYRKPRFYMPDGSPNDRWFAALCLGVPSCAGCKGYDHDRIGTAWASYGGLPTEKAWVLEDGT